MRKRSNLMVTLGLAVFLAGAAATFLVVRNSGDNASANDGGSVLYASSQIPAGTTGVGAVDQGLVKRKSVDAASKPPGAFGDVSQLVGKTAASTVPAGSILTSDQFAVPQTALGSVKIPQGKTALALQLDWVNGVAGYVAAGDHIDIFGVARDGPGSPSAKLIMQNTQVLAITPSASAGTQPAPGTNPTYLLAVSPPEAERLVYLTSFQKLYFSLVPKDAPAVGATPGSGAADALKQLS